MEVTFKASYCERSVPVHRRWCRASPALSSGHTLSRKQDTPVLGRVFGPRSNIKDRLLATRLEPKAIPRHVQASSEMARPRRMELSDPDLHQHQGRTRIATVDVQAGSAQTQITLTDDIPWKVPDAAPPNSVAEAVMAGGEGEEGAYLVLMKWYPGWMSAPHTYVTDRLCVVVSGVWWCNSPPGFRSRRGRAGLSGGLRSQRGGDAALRRRAS
jgi:hypothetical protein